MPVMPMSLSALLTSSSLNGLMIASIFCFDSPAPRPPGVSRPGRVPQEPCQWPVVEALLEDHPGFEHQTPLGTGEPGMAEHEARGAAESLHDGCIGAQEADAQLIGRGEG